MEGGQRDHTTVRLSKETWRDLRERKDTDDTFDDVLQELLDDT